MMIDHDEAWETREIWGFICFSIAPPIKWDLHRRISQVCWKRTNTLDQRKRFLVWRQGNRLIFGGEKQVEQPCHSCMHDPVIWGGTWVVTAIGSAAFQQAPGESSMDMWFAWRPATYPIQIGSSRNATAIKPWHVWPIETHCNPAGVRSLQPNLTKKRLGLSTIRSASFWLK